MSERQKVIQQNMLAIERVMDREKTALQELLAMFAEQEPVAETCCAS